MEEIVVVAVKEFVTEVMSKPFGTEERRQARKQFIDKMDAAVDLGVMSLEEYRRISRVRFLLEKEERRKQYEESMKKIDEAVEVCMTDVRRKQVEDFLRSMKEPQI